MTAPDGISIRIYRITVHRAAGVELATLPAEVLDSSSAMLNAEITPYGAAGVFFEYGEEGGFTARTPAIPSWRPISRRSTGRSRP